MTIMRQLLNQKGSSLIGALMTLMVLGFTGMAAVEMSTGENMASVNDMETQQALYVGQAGIEYAKDKLSQGLSPDINNKSFGRGSFSVVSSPDQSSFQVTSQVGSARRVQTIGANFSKDNTALDLTRAYVDENHLKNVDLVKFGGEAVVITGMIVDWEMGSCEADDEASIAANCVTGSWGDYSDEDDDSEDVEASVDAEESDDDILSENNSGVGSSYAAYEDPNHAGKILICHVPPGNPANAHTLSISVAGWEHGHNSGNGCKHNQDYLGSCSGYAGEISVDENNDGVADDLEEDDDDGDDNESTTCNDYEAFIYQCDNDNPANRDHGGIHVTSIGLEGQMIYDPASNLGSPALPGADGGETIVSEAMTLIEDGTYNFKGPGEAPTTYITFDTPLEEGRWYQLTILFSDGSQVTQSFKARGEADNASNEETSTEAGFVVADGQIIANENEDVELTVTGSEIYSGRSELSVTVELGVVGSDGNITYTPLNNSSDVDGGESYITATAEGGSVYVVRATAFKNGSELATYVSTNTTQVKTLINGDEAPSLPNQNASFAEFLNQYIVENIMVINGNSVMMLFELDADISQNAQHPDIDFDDLVVTLTFTGNGDVYYKSVGDQLHYLQKGK